MAKSASCSFADAIFIPDPVSVAPLGLISEIFAIRLPFCAVTVIVFVAPIPIAPPPFGCHPAFFIGFDKCGAKALFSLTWYAELDQRLLRGAAASPHIVLERGVVADRELHEWFARGDRREGAIVLLAPGGKEAARWSFHRGWPCRWEGPALHAWSQAVALERLEIAHEGLAWVAH